MSTNVIETVITDDRICVDGLTFRIAKDTEVLLNYQVFNHRFDRERQLKHMPEGFLPLCKVKADSKRFQVDKDSLVAVKTEYAQEVMLAASDGHTSASNMDYYVKAFGDMKPENAAQVNRYNKMKKVLPFFSKLTGYPDGIRAAAKQSEQEKPAAEPENKPKETAAAPSIKSFKLIGDCEPEKLAPLVAAAKGERSVQSFAAACGKSWPWMNNLLKAATRKHPVDMESLAKIAENAVTDSGVTLTALAEANGYILKRPGRPPKTKSAEQNAAKGEKAAEPAVTPEKAASAVSVPSTRSFCAYNVYEQIEHEDASSGDIWTEERYVCSFEYEDDAAKFARRYSSRHSHSKVPVLNRGVYVVRPAFYVSHDQYDDSLNPVSLLAKRNAPTVEHPDWVGYNIFVVNDCDTIIPGALHIQRHDGSKKFATDYDAARAAEKAGIPIIHDMPGVEDWTYLDTPENRLLISIRLPLYPKCDTRNWRRRKSNET